MTKNITNDLRNCLQNTNNYFTKFQGHKTKIRNHIYWAVCKYQEHNTWYLQLRIGEDCLANDSVHILL